MLCKFEYTLAYSAQNTIYFFEFYKKKRVDRIRPSSINRPLASQQRAEFGVPKGRQRAGRGKPASAGAAPANKQKITEPRRKEWAAACHGVGRKPGDGRPWHQCVAVASGTLSLRSGFRLFFMVSRGSVASRLHPCLCSDVPAGLRIPQAAPAR